MQERAWIESNAANERLGIRLLLGVSLDIRELLVQLLKETKDAK